MRKELCAYVLPFSSDSYFKEMFIVPGECGSLFLGKYSYHCLNRVVEADCVGRCVYLNSLVPDGRKANRE